MSGQNNDLIYPPAEALWPDAVALDAMLAKEDLRSHDRYFGMGQDAVSYKPSKHTAKKMALITAPHATAHWRDGIRKPADVFTGFLAETVAYQSDSACLIADGEQSHDANFYSDGVFKQTLRMLLPSTSMVVDLHGMSDEYNIDICLGTSVNSKLCANLYEALNANFVTAGFVVSTNTPYNAERPHTVTRTVQETQVPAVQIEIARWLRRPIDNPEPALLVAKCIADALAL